MVTEKAEVDSFTRFVVANEARLRHALIATCGGEAGREIAQEVLAYGWEHWDRLQGMENPVGYLYVMGRNLSRRRRRAGPVVFTEVPFDRTPHVEPALPKALASLSTRQRTSVVLVHCFQWTLSEVAEVMGISKTAVQNHLERGMASLRDTIGDVP
jgi:DNA-directed RNA polymerase specialized sigma24 family protein